MNYKKIIIIIVTLFVLSNQVYAIQANCTMISASNFSSNIKNIANNFCNINAFKNMIFFDDVTSVTINDNIRKGYFFVADKLYSLFEMPPQIYDYIYQTYCKDRNDELSCNNCFEDDCEQSIIYISNTKLAEATNISTLLGYSTECIDKLFPEEYDNTTNIIFIGIFGGIMSIPVIIGIGLVAEYSIKYLYVQTKKSYIYIKNIKILDKAKNYGSNLCV